MVTSRSGAAVRPTSVAREPAGRAATVLGFGTALPPVMDQTALWDDFFAGYYGHSRVARRLWRHAGVRTRHGVADPRLEDVSGWGTAARMRRFLEESLPLGKEALAACLADARLDPADVGQLTVVSCTGYATPGLDTLLARDLGLPRDVQRLHIGHMGCYAALPGLLTVADAAVARDRVALLLCLELTSLHIQPPTADVEQMVSHALFSDAAVGVVVGPSPGGGSSSGGVSSRGGFDVVDVVARTDVACADLMTWDVTDLGFRMGLSPRVPRVLEAHVGDVVADLLAAWGLGRGDVAGWAVHPGGPRIVDVVAERLGLDEADVAESRGVLRDHGNCSSPTILLVLDRIRERGDLQSGAPVVAMAFGPGLTLYVALLRVRR